MPARPPKQPYLKDGCFEKKKKKKNLSKKYEILGHLPYLSKLLFWILFELYMRGQDNW